MKLSQLIEPETISIGWPGSTEKDKTKWSLLSDLSSFLFNTKDFTEKQKSEILHLIEEREKSMTTGIGDGVAIPHASIPFLKKATAALCTIPEGLDFESIDRQKVYIVILILVPKNQFQKHIRTLAGIARLVHEPEFRKKLVESESASQLWDMILQKEGE